MRTKEISGTCVDTKLRGIEATCIVSGDRRRSYIISYNKQQNFDGVCLYVFTNDRANPRTHCQNNTHYETFTRRKTRLLYMQLMQMGHEDTYGDVMNF